MPKYAHIHLEISNIPKLPKGWYDTDLLNYPNLPPKNELREMTDEEWSQRHINSHHHNISNTFVARPEPTKEDIARSVRSKAKHALDKSDDIVLRCYEDGVPVPQEWKDYRTSLRRIIDGNGAQSLPEVPKSI
jgi:hypothetical protein